jgi:hypothetical protein
MTTSAIAVTEGSGKNIWTDQRSVSSVNREAQYVLLAEPALPTFNVTAEGVSCATSSSHLLQIMAGSSLYVRVHKIVVTQLAAATSIANPAIKIIRISTAGTTGTAVAVLQADMADTASLTGLSLPSSKGTETALFHSAAITLRTSTWVEAAGVWVWEPPARTKPLVITAGTSNGIVVAIGTGVAGATVNITATCTETAWL